MDFTDWRFRVWQIAIAFDQLLNCLIWIDCTWSDETFSAKCHRLSHKAGWARMERFVDSLFFWEEGHCKSAFDDERTRDQLPLVYREKSDAKAS